MSERMSNERAIEQIKNIKEYIINPHQAEPQSMLFKQTQRENRLQALDIAIESLIKQSEYDMHTHNVEFQLKLAEKKLNELGYAFNEYRGCIIAIDKADKE